MSSTFFLQTTSSFLLFPKIKELLIFFKVLRCLCVLFFEYMECLQVYETERTMSQIDVSIFQITFLTQFSHILRVQKKILCKIHKNSKTMLENIFSLKRCQSLLSHLN